MEQAIRRFRPHIYIHSECETDGDKNRFLVSPADLGGSQAATGGQEPK